MNVAEHANMVHIAARTVMYALTLTAKYIADFVEHDHYCEEYAQKGTKK